MKSLPPAAALFAAAVLAVVVLAAPPNPSAAAAGRDAQSQTSATATPIPPPTDEPTAAAATPSPRPRRSKAKPTATPTATPAPAATETPLPTPTATRIPLPRAHVSKRAPAATSGSGTAGYTTIPRYQHQNENAIKAPVPELSKIAWIAGTWTCTVSSHLDAHAPLKSVGQTTFVYDFTMNKRWMFGADGKGTEQHEITFDPLAKRWVFVRLGGDPSYGIAVSNEGWSGNAIHFEDEVEYIDGRDVHRRWTLTKRSNTHFTISDEEQSLEGDWLLEDEYDFTKSSS